jgi:hypothetical protein
MYAKKYAKDNDCAMHDWEYGSLIGPVADYIANGHRWNKIFFLTPSENFVDDHSRFMKHSKMSEREGMFNWLKHYAESTYWYEGITYLPGGDYLGNFETIKNYAKEIYENAYVD